MRFIANENFPGDSVEALRNAGHDVVWIRTDAPGSTDPDILSRAQLENRIVLTFDKDFGELAFRFGLPASSGIILFRISMASSNYVSAKTLEALSTHDEWQGNFAVIEDNRIRVTPLP